MQKPDLNQMWETFIRFSWEDVPSGKYIDIIRKKVYPLISSLKNKGIINWYCFLIHDRKSGVPTSQEDNNPYFHIRFALRKDVSSEQFLNSLPSYCVMTRKIERSWVEKIVGIDKSILKNEEIEEAWRIIGEQSKWFLDMLNIHKEEVEIPFQQVGQFLHFFANMTQLQVM